MHAYHQTERKDQCYLQPTHHHYCVSSFSLLRRSNCVSLSLYPFTYTHSLLSFVRMTKKRREKVESLDLLLLLSLARCRRSTSISGLILFATPFSLRHYHHHHHHHRCRHHYYFSWRRLPFTLLYHQHQFHHYHQPPLQFNHFNRFQIEQNQN